MSIPIADTLTCLNSQGYNQDFPLVNGPLQFRSYANFASLPAATIFPDGTFVAVVNENYRRYVSVAGVWVRDVTTGTLQESYNSYSGLPAIIRLDNTRQGVALDIHGATLSGFNGGYGLSLGTDGTSLVFNIQDSTQTDPQTTASPRSFFSINKRGEVLGRTETAMSQILQLAADVDTKIVIGDSQIREGGDLYLISGKGVAGFRGSSVHILGGAAGDATHNGYGASMDAAPNTGGDGAGLGVNCGDINIGGVNARSIVIGRSPSVPVCGLAPSGYLGPSDLSLQIWGGTQGLNLLNTTGAILLAPSNGVTVLPTWNGTQPIMTVSNAFFDGNAVKIWGGNNGYQNGPLWLEGLAGGSVGAEGYLSVGIVLDARAMANGGVWRLNATGQGRFEIASNKPDPTYSVQLYVDDGTDLERGTYAGADAACKLGHPSLRWLETYSMAYSGAAQTPTGSGAVSLSAASLGQTIVFTANGNVTSLSLAVGHPDQRATLLLVQDSAGTSTWPSVIANVKLPDGVFAKTIIANAVDRLDLICDGTVWYAQGSNLS